MNKNLRKICKCHSRSLRRKLGRLSPLCPSPTCSMHYQPQIIYPTGCSKNMCFSGSVFCLPLSQTCLHSELTLVFRKYPAKSNRSQGPGRAGKTIFLDHSVLALIYQNLRQSSLKQVLVMINPRQILQDKWTKTSMIKRRNQANQTQSMNILVIIQMLLLALS